MHIIYEEYKRPFYISKSQKHFFSMCCTMLWRILGICFIYRKVFSSKRRVQIGWSHSPEPPGGDKNHMDEPPETHLVVQQDGCMI